MRNLLIFISKYNAFFLFVIFEVAAIVIYIKYNSFQKASFINSTNQVVGSLYARVDGFKGYLTLREVNDSLAKENARLRNRLKSSFYIDSVAKGKVIDTVYKQQYEYITAKVINNAVNRPDNIITINAGSSAGIKKGMGVISDKGVVGKVLRVSEHFSVIQSLLHSETIISAMLADSRQIGTFSWESDLNPHRGLLYDVTNDASPRVGEQVVTSDHSLYPTGITIGKLINLRAKNAKGSFLSMDVALAVDFSKLQYVYVVVNEFATEQTGLEAQVKKDE
ncbi:rod shape-determining protein MreC [Mucilaginibacter calamicampi]|uniref:Cell shape-determining protein MreC n=1 Tax=Mucilaginibacter calamicampi TaxID=1302352 RepID=A0ABW2YQD3_9SPHI